MKKSLKQYPYDENIISSLLYLEDNLKQKPSTTLIKKTVQIYARLVEFFDEMKDPMKLYFIDKMQSVLCLVPFDNNKNSKKDKNVKIGNKFNLDKNCKINKYSFLNFDNKKRSSLKNDEITLNVDKYKNLIKGKKLIDIRKNQRIKKTILKQKLHDQKNNDFNKINKNLKTYQKNSEKKSNLIKNQLNLQKDKINKKLRERREKSIIKNKFSSSKFSSSFLSNSFGESKILNIIKPRERAETDINNKIDFNIWEVEKKNEYFGDFNDGRL